MENPNWYQITDPKDMVSPALLVYPDRIERNIQKMIEIAGGTENLRPHIKTHKIAEIIKLQIKWGIYKFKCATIAEAELLAKNDAIDVLLAIQPVKINIKRLFDLIEKYPNTQFSTIVDNLHTIQEVSRIALKKGVQIFLWLDINNGLDRSGISPGKEAIDLYKTLHKDPNIIAKGLHVYDGHIKQSDFEIRKSKCNEAFKPVEDLCKDLKKTDIDVPKIITGGTPTFPIHVKRENVETSPGTPLLWDANYGTLYKDLEFLPAAVLATRIISNPTSDLSCFDLGYKFVASENPLPRVHFYNIKNCEHISHHEEHLVVKHNNSKAFKIGDIFYGVPHHICPTVSRYKNVLTVKKGKITGTWKVAARDRILNI